MRLTDNLDESNRVPQDFGLSPEEMDDTRQQDEQEQDARADVENGLLEQQGEVETPRFTAPGCWAERQITVTDRVDGGGRGVVHDGRMTRMGGNQGQKRSVRVEVSVEKDMGLGLLLCGDEPA